MKDPILIALIVLAESEDLVEHDVTLLVGGFLVSGFVIGYEKYLQHHHTTVGFGKIMEEFDAENPEPEPKEKTYNFIHLRNAKYYIPGAIPIPGNVDIYVRIPLEAVQGFSFGKLALPE
jgi:hypothetical protein